MAADVITRFRLETTQFDSKLRDAAKTLQDIARTAQSGGKNFDDFSKKSIEAARALGTVQSGATNTKDKLKDLVGSFNDAAKAYNSLNETAKKGEFGKALEASLQKLQQDIKQTKEELYGLGDAVKSKSGGLFGNLGDKMGGAMQVFAGNVMTKIAGMGVELAGEMGEMITQGIELAKQGEGIRIAFERLGRGDILDGLRKATHGTVTDLELMKASVKFNDFKLPLDELATMLAFAQQKAKDTGQSVDYLVESIVNGLGRQSTQILDNLGLSQSEVKRRTAEVGDMTKAVGSIIREQMSAAGDYVETAADRAAQAHVSLQNKMEELGRKFAPVEEASSQLWTSMKIGILDIIGGPLATLLNQLTEAGRLKNMLNNMNGDAGTGNTKVNNQLKKLNVIKKGGGSNYIFNSTLNGMIEDYNRHIMALDAQIKNGGKPVGGGSGSSQDVGYLQQKMDALKVMRDQLAAGAKEINKPIKIESNIPDLTGGGGGKGGNTTITEEKDEFTEIIGLVGNAQERVSDLQRQISESWDEGEIAKLTGELKVAQTELQRLKDIGKEKPMQQGLSGFNQQTMSAWMQGRQGDLAKANYGTKGYKDIIANIADMTAIKTVLDTTIKNAIDTTQIDMTPMWSKMFGEKLPEGQTANLSDALEKMYEQAFDGINIKDSSLQSVVDIINEKLKEMKLEPINIEFKTGEIAKDGKVIKGSYKDAASAVNSLGSALSGLDDPGAKIAGTIAQAIANIALAFSSADLKEGESGNIWYWIAATAAGMATMISTISSIHSATGYQNGGVVKGYQHGGVVKGYQRGGVVKGYAGGKPVMGYAGGGSIGYAGGGSIGSAISGGMITGSTYSNDQIPIMANAGEVVLTNAMTTTLASKLNDQGNTGYVPSHISGEQIYIALNRFMRRSGRGEIVTWKS